MSQVSIVNQALALLGQDPIISLDDDSNAAKVSKQFYAPVRDAMFELHNWTFATEWKGLPKSTTVGVGPYKNIFPIPSNVLRIIWVGSAGDGESVVDYAIDANGILTNSDTCVVQAVISNKDTTTYSPLFVQAFAARLAADMAVAITASQSLSGSMYQVFSTKLAEAKQRDSLQGTSKQITSKWVHGGRGRRGTNIGGTV